MHLTVETRRVAIPDRAMRCRSIFSPAHGGVRACKLDVERFPEDICRVTFFPFNRTRVNQAVNQVSTRCQPG